MKKFLFLILTIALFSCDEAEFNNPAFEALLENEFWEASLFDAQLNGDGSLTINAKTANQEVLVLKVSSTAVNSPFALGVNAVDFATYQIGGGEVHTTGMNIGDGEIVITELTSTTVSGRFRFNAVKPASDPEEVVNMQNGNFVGVPIVTGAAARN